MTLSYESLYRICRGKRVILVTATPLNNSPNDILSQIKLFQNARKSTLPTRRCATSRVYLIPSRDGLMGSTGNGTAKST
jgi:hypothetical protein